MLAVEQANAFFGDGGRERAKSFNKDFLTVVNTLSPNSDLQQISPYILTMYQTHGL